MKTRTYILNRVVLILVLFFCFNCKPDAIVNTANFDDAEAIETKISKLLSKMTLEEKIGQTNLRGSSSTVEGKLPEALKIAVRKGQIGAFLNDMNKDDVK